MRIVLDEAHSAFMSESYRKKMQALVHLREAPARKIFLTATLVPAHEQVLADRVRINLSRTLVLRNPVARPNHRLQIVSLPPPREPSSVGLQLASLLLKKWVNDGAVRGIIFVRSLLKLRDLSESSTFPVRTYNGQMTEQEKEFQLHSWLSNDDPAKWMIATTALIHGVDYPRVDAVIFLESPYGLYDYVQGAGRAGRTGQESLIAILHAGPSSILPDENPNSCRAEMEHLLDATVCRRLGISGFMDGQPQSCFQVFGSVLCDICDGHVDPVIQRAIDSPSTPAGTTPGARNANLQPPLRPPPAALSTEHDTEANSSPRHRHGVAVRDLMADLAGCFVCRIKSNGQDPCHSECAGSRASGCKVRKHVPYSCTEYTYKIGWMNWKKTFPWPHDVSRCHFCGFPYSVVGFDHQKKGRFPGICQFSDTARVAAWHVLHSRELLEKLQNDLGFVLNGPKDSAFAAWLNQYGSDSKEINLLSAFSWLCRQYYPNRAYFE